MKRPLISVVMLTCDRKELMTGMMTDILGQSYPELEFIIIDNGSTDGSADVLNAWADKDSRIRLRHLPKSSIGCGRNAGARLASGQYITFVDDDDRVDSDFLSFLADLTEHGQHQISICGTDRSTDGMTYQPQCVFDVHKAVGPEEAVRLLLGRQQIRAGMPGKLVHTDIIQKYPFREDCAHEDIFTTYKYLAAAQSVSLYGKPKYHSLRHGQNCSYFTTNPALWTPVKLDEYMRAFHERTDFLTRHFPQLAAYARYTEWSYMLSMLDKIETYHLEDCEKQKQYMRSVITAHATELAHCPWLDDVEVHRLARHRL